MGQQKRRGNYILTATDEILRILTILNLQDSLYKFNVFHVRALYYTKTLSPANAQRVLSSVVTHSYMFRPCWVIFRENFPLSLH
jgi:hypothetical protein